MTLILLMGLRSSHEDEDEWVRSEDNGE